MTKIEWTERTWNPIVGCSVVSPGCTNCYAMRMAARIERMSPALEHYRGLTKPSKAGPVFTGKVARAPERTLQEPLRVRKPTMWFVNSMGDLFHESVPDEWIDRVFAVMALCPQHTFQVLTKRSARMRAYLSESDWQWAARARQALRSVARTTLEMVGAREELDGIRNLRRPLRNVWLGVSAEDQRRADERIPDLLNTPAAVRFVSAEPLLGPIDFTFVGNAEPVAGSVRYDALTGHAIPYDGVIRGIGTWATNKATTCARLDWVIVGGESGKGARPMHPDWARSIRDQCSGRDDRLHLNGYPDVPFFFKQWGEWRPSVAPPFEPDAHLVRMSDGRHGPLGSVVGESLAGVIRVGKARAGRLLDGRTHDAMPTTQREVAA